MHVTHKALREIASTARIGLADDEIEKTCFDLNLIIDSLEPITRYDLEGVEPTFHPIAGLTNVMREDVERPGLTQEEALANAPATQNGQFRIPPILGDGGGDR
ncbi:MAG: Asp-tRNA(Asn)/Glu-tRNA(Gln) amidotransferase subunit GatC [Coriobacteriales bacterium]|jgi:aspartyl-tRNA(Asn)/glutamyl-tRNA(Gln) amidotransferase subunit C|nr:Asp-tRNA(Asn)/Glu-tRNA(Gln) amidotransferase subunit GatC [Coriobacteriales bacterium]